MIQTKEKFIEGSTYLVTQLPARRAIRLKAKLIKMFGPVFAQVLITSTDATSDFEKKVDIVRAIEILSCQIEENSFENIVMELLNGVRKDGVELNQATIDMEFAGDMGTLYQVIWFVIEVNFANFFSLLGINIGNQSSKEESQKEDTRKIYKRA